MNDDTLRARLATADPAGALSALDEERITRMTENAISQAEQPARQSRRRATAIWAGVGGGVLVAAAATATVLAIAPGGTPTRLTDGGSDPTAMCIAITADALAQNANAFKGTVTSVEDGEATLHVDAVYKGEVGGVVVVEQDDPTGADFSATQYEQGGTYLISFNDGAVAYCGQSGPDSPELEALYAAAYN